MLLNNYQGVFRLAKKRRINHDENLKVALLERFENMAFDDYMNKDHENELELYNFLCALDFETVKVLQTLMYLGRDKDYNGNLTSKNIYLEERRYFDNQIGWKTKEIEINQMVEKLPLDEYLEEALKILRINL
ncbi:hypothetical protein ACDI16_02440 [Oceanobacillus caeni]